MSCIAGLISVTPALARAPDCNSDRQAVTIDPVFKLNLPASFYEAHYARASPALLNECGITVSKKADYRYWVFASVNAGPDQYVILGGEVRDNTGQDTPKGRWSPDMFGNLDQISAGKCTAISWPIDIFCSAGSGPPPVAVLNKLAADTVARYEAAFGSRAGFMEELKKQDRIPNDPGLKILNQALATQQ
ncbi:hypothetical protein [Acidocella sp. MX-AZ02]|uniref:hypothetical protein n=2 Tax=unclassified Acidocella TaxID=2648610 RepID=UPI001969B8EF|nr:hypothetical protein [Acidocella sp. MX-AZ02]